MVNELPFEVYVDTGNAVITHCFIFNWFVVFDLQCGSIVMFEFKVET